VRCEEKLGVDINDRSKERKGFMPSCVEILW